MKRLENLETQFSSFPISDLNNIHVKTVGLK
jgi:hypothetical protein